MGKLPASASIGISPPSESARADLALGGGDTDRRQTRRARAEGRTADDAIPGPNKEMRGRRRVENFPRDDPDRSSHSSRLFFFCTRTKQGRKNDVPINFAHSLIYSDSCATLPTLTSTRENLFGSHQGVSILGSYLKTAASSGCLSLSGTITLQSTDITYH